jgi:DHA2 family multidrug resistance protein
MSSTAQPTIPTLTGAALIIASMLLALGNFMVVLDMTIANVSVPTIAGGLAVSPNQGTWVITSYSVAEAITVPLTGWLAARFGAVRIFLFGLIGFGVCSALCGLAPSLGWLVLFRVMQGLCGGPIMPMSMTLMMSIFPPSQRGQAMGLWSMTTVVAPIIGPILGGSICDNVGWEWIFYINVPVAAACAFFASRVLAGHETQTVKKPIDYVGLLLLIVFIAAMQIMLDKGKELEWFSSPIIIGLALVAVIGFIAFLIWELTAADPIVDLRVFRHRGFTAAVITISLTFGAFFASIVLIPLWLQTNMGYTATKAGLVTGWGGVLAVVMSPIVPRLIGRIDHRVLVSFGVLWLACVAVVRSEFATTIAFWSIALTFLAQGFAMPFFFIPTNQIALASVEPHETASAAGLSNFLRTTSAAFGTSLITTSWDRDIGQNKAAMVGELNDPQGAVDKLRGIGMTGDQAVRQLDNLTQNQAVMLATDHLLLITAVVFVIAAMVVWIAPKPQAGMVQGGGGH